MHVLLDCDGVLADCRRHVVDLLGIGLDPNAPGPFDFDVWLPAPWNKMADDLLSTSEFWMTLPEIPGARQGLQRFREQGISFSVVTSPWLPCPMWGHARYLWLEKHFGISPDDVLIGKNKALVGGGDVFIDDRADHIHRWKAVNSGLALLFDAPHNTECLDLPRVNWGRIVEILT